MCCSVLFFIPDSFDCSFPAVFLRAAIYNISCRAVQYASGRQVKIQFTKKGTGSRNSVHKNKKAKSRARTTQICDLRPLQKKKHNNEPCHWIKRQVPSRVDQEGAFLVCTPQNTALKKSGGRGHCHSTSSCATTKTVHVS